MRYKDLIEIKDEDFKRITGVRRETFFSMLEEFRREATKKIEKYNNIRTNVSNKLGEDNQAALAFYDPVFVPTSNRFEGFEIVTESE
mgnify:CR=1 FL=1